MNPQKHSASVAEEQMLAHFRAHAPQQPAPALDQAILAAARRQAAHVEPARSWWRRWLEASRRPRWQAAFASLLGVALVLGLVSHNVLDDVPSCVLRPEVAFSDAPRATESPLGGEAGHARAGGAGSAVRRDAGAPGLAGQLRIVRGGAAPIVEAALPVWLPCRPTCRPRPRSRRRFRGAGRRLRRPARQGGCGEAGGVEALGGPCPA